MYCKRTSNTEKSIVMHELATTILLPMRNESSRLESKILSVVEEIAPHKLIKLMIIDSNSFDETYHSSVKVLERSLLPNERWTVLKSEFGGKSLAINMAIEAIESTGDEIVVIMDTDILVDFGWLKTIHGAFDDPEIAAVSGIENIEGENTIFATYKNTSNQIRSMNSDYGISTILEGGLMAIRVNLLAGFRLNEGVNADDTQLALESLRRGHKSIVLNSLKFREGNLSKSRFKQGLRRSQGLSRVLAYNYDLVFKSKGVRAKLAFFNSLLVYTLVPWACIFLMLVSLGGLMGGIVLGVHSLMDIIFVGSLVLLPQGRALFWGSLVSVISQTQYVAGVNYATWDPNTQ